MFFLSFERFFLAVAVVGLLIVRMLGYFGDGGEETGAIFIFSEPAEPLLDFCLVVVDCIFDWGVAGVIAR